MCALCSADHSRGFSPTETSRAVQGMVGQRWAAKTRESSLVSSNGSPEESGIEDGQQEQHTTAKLVFLSSLLTSIKHFYWGIISGLSDLPGFVSLSITTLFDQMLHQSFMSIKLRAMFRISAMDLSKS